MYIPGPLAQVWYHKQCAEPAHINHQSRKRPTDLSTGLMKAVLSLAPLLRLANKVIYHTRHITHVRYACRHSSAYTNSHRHIFTRNLHLKTQTHTFMQHTQLTHAHTSTRSDPNTWPDITHIFMRWLLQTYTQSCTVLCLRRQEA